MDELQRLHDLDNALVVFNKKLNLNAHLFPINVLEQREIFLAHEGDYDPQFIYNFPTEESLEDIITQLRGLQKDFFDDQVYTLGIAHLLSTKIEENIWKAELLLAYRHQDFDRIHQYTTLLFGEFDTAVLEIAKELTKTYHPAPASLRGELLDADGVETALNEYVLQHGFTDLKIASHTHTPSKFSIRFSKHGARLVFNKRITVRTIDLQADIIHEIGVHYARYQAGKERGWNILTYGTAKYSCIEEGLAIYQYTQFKRTYYPAFQKIGIYQKYLFLYDMVGKSAKDMYQYLRSQGISKNPQVIFDIILRSKFGIQDCSARKRGNMFPQMKLYADGYHQVLDRLAQGHTLEELFVGKVHINDLPYLDG